MKKKLWITSLLAAFSITAVAGGVALSKDKAVVTDAAEWQVATIEDSYAYGTFFEVPEASVVINGETVAATATVTYPDGLSVSDDTVALSQAGVYTVTYRAVVGDTHCVQEDTFTVENSGYTVGSAKSSVTYGSYTKLGANSEGLLVNLASSDTLTFSQLINVDELTGMDSIIDLFITPPSTGVYDFSKLVIRLTDAYDSSVYMQFQLRRYSAEDRGFSTGYLDVSFNGLPWVGCEGGNYRTNGWGSPFTFSFSAAMHKGMAWWGDVLPLAPDAYTCKVYYNPTTTEARVCNAHIANLNNQQLFADVWNGWPSGKARLTLTAEEVKSETANFCIKSVFGIDLTQNTFTETDGPIVSVSKAEDEMPLAQTGIAYPIPAATARDLYSGNCDVKVSVYRDYASDTPINVGVANGAFKPTVAGWHTIVYSAKDALGNEGIVTRNVYVADDLGNIEITLPEEKITSAMLGVWVPVSAATYTGDCGIADMKITASIGNKTIDVTDGFRPEIAGDWTIKYTVTDYIGRAGTAEYTMTATAGEDSILLDDLVLPQVYLSDCEYVLPELYATNYSTGVAVLSLCDVVVTDKNGETTYKAGDAFTPSVENNGDFVTVAYKSGDETLATKAVPTIIAKGDGDKIVAKNYFYGEGFSTSYEYPKVDKNGKPVLDDDGNPVMTYYSAGIEITADAPSELCGWTFATPQLTNNFKLEFEGIKEKAIFEALVITLTDSVNPNEQISITLGAKAKGTTITVGDTVMETDAVTLITDKQYSLTYIDGKFTFGGMTIAAKKTVNGEEFTGFSSTLAYVKVEMKNARTGAGYLLRSINESNITRRNLEVFAPNFQILGNFGGNQSLNNVFEIYPAIGNDVFAPNTSLTMTVIAPDGSIVVDNDGVKLENVQTDKSYFITLTQYGKYQVAYSAVEKDWVTSNALNVTSAVFVIDEAAPQVVFTNATQTTAKVGDIITCPDVVFKDNVSAEENMMVVKGVITSTGKYHMFTGDENAIKCAYEGEYKFIVMVYDEFGNMKSVTHTITVTK